MFKLRYILYTLILSLIMFIAFKGIDLMKNVSNVDQEKFEMLMSSEYQKYLYDNPISASSVSYTHLTLPTIGCV